MNHESTITQAEGEITATTIRLKAELWNRTRKLAIDLGVSANQIVNEGLELRIAQLERDPAPSAGDTAEADHPPTTKPNAKRA